MDNARPSGGLAVMQDRRTPAASLDFFPTPPWATRALCEIVLPELGLPLQPFNTVHEPACGAGHMAEVLREYFGVVFATDIQEYGYHTGEIDFLAGEPDAERDFDWIITNPPFNLAGAFARRALQETRVGAAFLVRSAWLEGGGAIGRFSRSTRPWPSRNSASACPWSKGDGTPRPRPRPPIAGSCGRRAPAICRRGFSGFRQASARRSRATMTFSASQEMAVERSPETIAAHT